MNWNRGDQSSQERPVALPEMPIQNNTHRLSAPASTPTKPSPRSMPPPPAGISTRPSPSSPNELHSLLDGTEVPGSLPPPRGSVPRDASPGEKNGKRKKPPAFARAWSAADEVRILECLAAHVKAHGAPPVRAKLHGVVAAHVLDKQEFTMTEIYEKVRRLRTRYQNLRTAGAGGGDGEELRKYELSKEIWGDSLPPPPKRANKEGGSDEEAPNTCVRRGFEELQHMYPHLAAAVEQISTADRGYLRRAFELIGDDKAGELDAKVKKQRRLEVKTDLDRRTVRREVLSTLIRYVD